VNSDGATRDWTSTFIGSQSKYVGSFLTFLGLQTSIYVCHLWLEHILERGKDLLKNDYF